MCVCARLDFSCGSKVRVRVSASVPLPLHQALPSPFAADGAHWRPLGSLQYRKGDLRMAPIDEGAASSSHFPTSPRGLPGAARECRQADSVRCLLHFDMKLSDLAGSIQAARIYGSGCLFQLLVPFAKRRSLLGGLKRGSCGLPEGMSQAYFDLAVKQHGVLGWRDGCLTL